MALIDNFGPKKVRGVRVRGGDATPQKTMLPHRQRINPPVLKPVLEDGKELVDWCRSLATIDGGNPLWFEDVAANLDKLTFTERIVGTEFEGARVFPTWGDQKNAERLSIAIPMIVDTSITWTGDTDPFTVKSFKDPRVPVLRKAAYHANAIGDPFAKNFVAEDDHPSAMRGFPKRCSLFMKLVELMDELDRRVAKHIVTSPTFPDKHGNRKAAKCMPSQEQAIEFVYNSRRPFFAKECKSFKNPQGQWVPDKETECPYSDKLFLMRDAYYSDASAAGTPGDNPAVRAGADYGHNVVGPDPKDPRQNITTFVRDPHRFIELRVNKFDPGKTVPRPLTLAERRVFLGHKALFLVVFRPEWRCTQKDGISFAGRADIMDLTYLCRIETAPDPRRAGTKLNLLACKSVPSVIDTCAAPATDASAPAMPACLQDDEPTAEEAAELDALAREAEEAAAAAAAAEEQQPPTKRHKVQADDAPIEDAFI